MSKDKTKACYNCKNYQYTKGINGNLSGHWRCIVDNVTRAHNTPCAHLNKFMFIHDN